MEATSERYIHRENWDTYYDASVVDAIRAAKGEAYLYDELAREEDPTYIRPHIEATLNIIDIESLAGKSLLDFGCGCGSSTVILSQLLPNTKITGLELDPKNLAAAKARARFHNLDVEFLQSPGGDQLPADLGQFDAIFLPAVFEHLLPNERRSLMPLLWQHLKSGGVLFVDETPWRWFPVETHTTGLPLINYLPDSLANRYAKLSRRITPDMDWSTLLRMGIRGATEAEVLSVLPGELMPHDRVVTWARGYAHTPLKRALVPVLRLLRWVPYLSMAIRKEAA